MQNTGKIGVNPEGLPVKGFGVREAVLDGQGIAELAVGEVVLAGDSDRVTPERFVASPVCGLEEGESQEGAQGEGCGGVGGPTGVEAGKKVMSNPRGGNGESDLGDVGVTIGDDLDPGGDESDDGKESDEKPGPSEGEHRESFSGQKAGEGDCHAQQEGA